MILFLAEKEHIKYVRKFLEDNFVNIDYKEIKIPKRTQSDFFRFNLEFNIINNIFTLSKKLKSFKIIFTSVRSSTLISIKILTRFFKDVDVISVLHGDLNSISAMPLVPTRIIFWIKIWLQFFNSKRLLYLVLGSPIEKNLIKELPKLAGYVYSIDHPYFYKSHQISGFSFNQKIKFGYLGVIHVMKGINLFFKLSEDINQIKEIKNAEFLVIGHLTDKSAEKFPKSVFVPSPYVPLSQEEYGNYVKEVDYVVFVYGEQYSKLRASATLFDAFSYLKPIIAFRNPYLQYYFDKMGDIGYLCDSYEEMKDIIIKIIKNPSNKRYVKQQQNLLEGREKFNFDRLSEKFKMIWK